MIVNYKTGEMVRECLRSLAEVVTVPYEVIVVDNASGDPEFESLTESSVLKLIRNPVNAGFSKACNVGARAASGRVLHFLNPDTLATRSLGDLYRAALADSNGEIYVTRILNPRGEPEKSGHAFPTLRNLRNMTLRRGEVAKWYLGASFLLDKDLFWSLGGMSEDYFMYGEDVDFFYKAHLRGVPVVQSEAEIVHLSGGSSGKVWSSKQRLERVERGAMIFTHKFGLRLDYFVFKHAAFLMAFWREPLSSLMGLYIYWKELLRSLVSAPTPKWSVQ